MGVTLVRAAVLLGALAAAGGGVPVVAVAAEPAAPLAPLARPQYGDYAGYFVSFLDVRARHAASVTVRLPQLDCSGADASGSVTIGQSLYGRPVGTGADDVADATVFGVCDHGNPLLLATASVTSEGPSTGFGVRVAPGSTLVFAVSSSRAGSTASITQGGRTVVAATGDGFGVEGTADYTRVDGDAPPSFSPVRFSAADVDGQTLAALFAVRSAQDDDAGHPLVAAGRLDADGRGFVARSTARNP